MPSANWIVDGSGLIKYCRNGDFKIQPFGTFPIANASNETFGTQIYLYNVAGTNYASSGAVYNNGSPQHVNGAAESATHFCSFLP